MEIRFPAGRRTELRRRDPLNARRQARAALITEISVDAYDRMMKGDARFRIVLTMGQ